MPLVELVFPFVPPEEAAFAEGLAAPEEELLAEEPAVDAAVDEDALLTEAAIF